MFQRKRTENAEFTKCQDNLVLLIPIVSILSVQWAVLFSKHIPSNINNRYLGFKAVFCTCQVCMTPSYNPQLQGRLTEVLLKKACQSRASCCFCRTFWVSLVKLTFFHGAVLLAVWAACGCGVQRSCITNSSHSLCWGNPDCHKKTGRERRDRGKIHKKKKRQTNKKVSQAFQRKQGNLNI